MTVSIANMTSVWMSNSNVYNAISMSISTMGYGGNTGSRVLNLSVDANTIFSVDTRGTQFTKANTVASLPSPTLGARSFVIDCSNASYTANAIYYNNFGNTVIGGGSTSVPVFSDGINWRIG